jgi:hypothetical protein
LPFTSKVSHSEGSDLVRENLKEVAEIMRNVMRSGREGLLMVILSIMMWGICYRFKCSINLTFECLLNIRKFFH